MTSATQTESISKASPTVSATGPASDTTGAVITSGSISSVLAGSSGTNSSGTITFKVFGPQTSAPTNCTSGGTTVGTASVSGNATYHPSAGYTPTTAGNYFWFASYGGDTSNASATSSCGAGMSVTVVGGSTATKLVFTSSPVSGQAANNASLGPITVTVENASNNPVTVTVATTVTLSSSSTGTYIFNKTQNATSPTGSTTVSIPSGSSSVSFYYGDTFAGTPTITATSGTLTKATQTETVTPGAAVISILSGNNQSATQGNGFANPLVVKVADSFNNLVSGANVTFTAPATGASGTFTNSSNAITVASGSNGQASEIFAANHTGGGQYNVSASAGTNTVNFSLLNGMNFTVTGPANLAPVYPGGTSRPIDLAIYNPNPESIAVPVNSLAGSVSSIANGDANKSLPACNTSWFSVTTSSSTASLTVGAGATVLLDSSVLQTDWPFLKMIDEANVNQDNCAGATLRLTFTGTASGS